MKSVLISIQPKWVEKIVKGEKTIEVRKTRPKIDTPFKCYIYCTKNRDNEIYKRYKVDDIKSGKVIGYFVCDRIDSYIIHDEDNKDYWDLSVKEWEYLKQKSCLTIPQILEYSEHSDNLYGWHISDLKIYDVPKELSEFKTGCKGCKERDTYHCKFYCYGERHITRPPQSYMFVKELQEEIND